MVAAVHFDQAMTVAENEEIRCDVVSKNDGGGV